MIAFNESRRLVNLRKAVQDLTMIDLNPILLGWIEESKRVIIAEAERVERRMEHVQTRKDGAVLVG